MAWQIDGHDAIRFGKLRHLVVPEISIAGPTMNEDKRRLPLALHGIMNRHAISSGNHLRLRLRLSRRKNKREQQQNIEKHVSPHVSICQPQKSTNSGKNLAQRCVWREPAGEIRDVGLYVGEALRMTLNLVARRFLDKARAAF